MADGWIAVEIKRVGTIDAVEQLSRYLERIRLDPAMADCRGVLAAQVVKPQARVLAEARGIAWVEVDLAELRGEREPALTLFGSYRTRLPPMSDDPVLTERRDGVLLDHPQPAAGPQRGQPRARPGRRRRAGRARRRRRAEGRGAQRRGRVVLRRHGSQGVRGRREPVCRGPRLRRASSQRSARKPLIAAIEGYARGRRLRGRAGLRPDRRRARRAARASPRPSAGWSPPAARCSGCRAGSPTTWRWSSR